MLFPTGQPDQLETFDEYLNSGGYSRWKTESPLTGSQILDAVQESGLTGRGGAGFPVGRKWTLAAHGSAAERYVVCNGGEDEPGSHKDRVLLEFRPHLVLEGALLCAAAIQARTVFFYINEHYKQGMARLTQSVAEAGAAGFLQDVEVRFVEAPTVYVAGEDSAALEVIEGRAALPRQKPPYPTEQGLWGKPTVVNNVETLANIPGIVRHGPARFRRNGTSERPGTMLFCLGDEVERPGVYELPIGASLLHLLEACGGGLKGGRRVKAILPGGPSCAFLSADHLDIALDPESLRNAGSSLGCGAMRFIPEGTRMLEVVAEIAKFFQRESCGQCPACRMETNTLALMLERVKVGQGGAALLEQVEKVLDFNRGKGFCALIHMPGPPLLSAMKLFPEDFGTGA